MKVSFPARDTSRGAAWLSSARVVRCWVKSTTSATPTFSCHHVMVSTLEGLPVKNRRKVGMTSSPHGLYVQGYTRTTMGGTMSCKPARGSQSQKTVLSSDWSLQLDSMKLESLVIADQQAAVNTFPGLVHTARHITKVRCTRSRRLNRKGITVQGMTGDWGEVVTR